MDLRRLQRALRRKLNAVEDRSTHHVLWYVVIGDEEYLAARHSHSNSGQLPQFIISDTAKRLRLSRSELDSLVNCPLGRDKFLSLWEERS